MRWTKREVERPPWWVHTAVPVRYGAPVAAVSTILGLIVANLLGVPALLGIAGGGAILPGIFEVWWRKTRPPSKDRRWGALARSMYQRRN